MAKRVPWFFAQARMCLRMARNTTGERREALIIEATKWRQLAKDTRARGAWRATG